MPSRMNLSGRGHRGGRGGGYGGGTLGQVYGGPANLVNPKMEQYRRQQSGEELVRADDRAQARIARAQQTGVGRGTQEQIVRSSTPGGTGYNRAEAIAREIELSRRPVAEQMAMLGRRANPNAGNPNKPPPPGGVRTVQPQAKGGVTDPQWTPEQKQRWRQDQKDLQNPFGPRWRKGEEGKWSAEQKAGWARGESPRQQLAGITGGQAGIDRAWARMTANTGRERPTARAQPAPSPVAKPAVEPVSSGGGMVAQRAPGSPGAIDASGFSPNRIRGFGGSARSRSGRVGPGMSGKLKPRGAPARRTGGLGGASKSPRSRGLRGRGIGRGMGGTL